MKLRLSEILSEMPIFKAADRVLLENFSDAEEMLLPFLREIGSLNGKSFTPLSDCLSAIGDYLEARADLGVADGK